MRALLAIGLVGVLCSVAAAAPLDIVRDGQPLAAIVVAADASDQVRSAAALLADFVEQSTGAKLPVGDTAPDEGTVIYVGPGPVVEGFGIDQAKLDGDGFDIAFPDARSIVILGPTDYGTEFGVCEFLERYVGVRWLLPGKDGTDVPEQDTLSVEPEPVHEEPAFFSRLFSGLVGAPQGEWARRNRMHGRIQFHHNLLHLFPADTYTKTHPEFFPVKAPGQERFMPPDNDASGWQPCFTAPGIVEEAISNINRYFDENPDVTSYSLGTNDSSGFCQCESCLARISGEKNFLGRTDYSDLFYSWANEVIDGVLEKHPDKWFGCLAYSEVASPPRTVNVHPRLIPYMTYDRMKWVDPELYAEGTETTRRWEAKSPRLGWYDYIYGTPYVLPRVWFHHMGSYYQFGHTHGVRALYAEAYPNWGEGPKLYISLKLQWDPTLDVDALLDEWYERCVGTEAAPYLAAYYAHWEEFWTTRVLDSAWFTKGGQYLRFSDPGYLKDISLDEIRESRELLDMTVEKAQTEKQKARAELLRQAFEYYEATAFAFKVDTVPEDQPITTVEQALKVLDGAGDAVDFAARRNHLALDVFPKDPVLVHPLPIDRYGLTRGESWGAGSLWRVYDMATRSEPVRDRLREMAKTSASDLVRLQAQMMVSLMDKTLVSLTTNPSFEDGEGAVADGWTWWVKYGIGRMLRSDDVAHTGEFSVLCDGMSRGGPVQSVPLTPGKYALVCFVYIPEGQAPGGTTELSMTLRDDAGVNLPSTSTRIVPAPGQWTAMAVAAEVPATIGDKEVKSMLPILIVDGFEPGQKAYFDDLMLYRLEE